MTKPLQLAPHDNRGIPIGAPDSAERRRQLSELIKHEQHPDLLSPAEAVSYLRLGEACPSDSAARSLLSRLCQQGKLVGFTWGATRLYHRATLDAFVAAELADLQLIHSAKAPCNDADQSF